MLIIININAGDKFNIYHDGIPVVEEISGGELARDNALDECERYTHTRVWID